MISKYVYNWYSAILVYINLIPSTTLRFRNGKKVFLSKSNYQEFREELFKQYLEDQGFSYSFRDGRTLVKTNTGLKLIILPDYSNVIDEVYVSNAYRAANLSGRTVIDVGASVGDTALYFASLGASRVYAFEVCESRYKIAQENILLNGMDKIINIINEEANSKSISNIVEYNHLSHVLLKLDCEGCELQVIPNIPDNIYRQIDDIVMEYHKGQHAIITNK
jgi:hypothetical protein